MALIDISRLSFTYEGSYDPVFQDLSLQLDTDWRLGLIGRNGRGKTTLLRLLMGQETYRGTISSPVAFDYFPFSVPDGARTGEEVAEALHPGLERWRLLRELHLLDLDEGVLYHPFGTLSNGEQTKCLLAALFCGEERYLLIDEPTNHLDAAGRRAVADYLRRKRGVLLVSHDRDFLDGCVDHILALNKTGFEVQSGNFSTWWENRERRDAFEQAKMSGCKRISAGFLPRPGGPPVGQTGWRPANTGKTLLTRVISAINQPR